MERGAAGGHLGAGMAEEPLDDVLGALVIAAVESGMGLLGWPSDRKFIVTGCILLLAVTIDTVTRRARQSSGRA